ncbi:hypothetical protein BDV28DRAFT_77760 [Aspergillus coremiiformis]|uniref:Uncharacterized protein n=1 Tax=Aspergillus coremiiformis TaxID=138285 RepID=A0A5N6YTF7_9EURO|nr:hypothetical protein BDV28DRAFT_77760 [Aspergillus coremiiformis]
MSDADPLLGAVDEMDIDFAPLIRKQPLPTRESALIRKKKIIQQGQKNLRRRRSMRNDMLPYDLRLVKARLKVVARSKNKVTLPVAKPVPSSKPPAVLIDAGQKNDDRKPEVGESSRPKYTGLLYFPKTAKAQALQRPPTLRVRPIMDLRRIKISPSLQVADCQASRDAAAVEDLPHFYPAVNGKRVPLQEPSIYVDEKIASMTERSSSWEDDRGWQNPPRDLVARVEIKWQLLLLCIAILWYMWPTGDIDHQE